MHRTDPPRVLVLGAGLSGLGAGFESSLPVYEAADHVGGVCRSYYVDAQGNRCEDAVRRDDCFRFEPAGGHWLFGASPPTLDTLRRFGPLRRYCRKAAVYFSRDERLVPFPLQDNLWAMPAPLRRRVLDELEQPPAPHTDDGSFRDWLLASFGATLCEAFFFPFNDRYTAGLFDRVAPQDLYKTVIDVDRVRRGAVAAQDGAGYNVDFYYPAQGLGQLVEALADQCDIRLGRRAVAVDRTRRTVAFADGAELAYDALISTLPLDRTIGLAAVDVPAPPDPATAVLVLNIAAERGTRCPSCHWVYLPDAQSGFHRIGFYSAVDASFLPVGERARDRLVSLYAERSFLAGAAPTSDEQQRLVSRLIEELESWGFIGDVLVADCTYTDPAYTWRWIASPWASQASAALSSDGIVSIGRYGGWKFQGMAASFEQGRATARAVMRAAVEQQEQRSSAEHARYPRSRNAPLPEEAR